MGKSLSNKIICKFERASIKNSALAMQRDRLHLFQFSNDYSKYLNLFIRNFIFAELARHLLDGAETFDTRAWLAAVAIVMTTLLILTVGTCCVLYRDSHVSSCKFQCSQ